MVHGTVRLGMLAALLLACVPAGAQTVGLAGVLGGRALLLVDGAAPRTLSPGETHLGVKLISVGNDSAEVDVGGQRVRLRMGDAPASVGARDSGGRIVLPSDGRGHFISDGRINGQAMRFMVDTGATMLAIGAAEADRMGIAYRNGQRVRMGTANGEAQGWMVKLDSVRVGDVELTSLDAVVVPAALPYVLLGNNFLARFQMTRTSDQMVLQRRY